MVRQAAWRLACPDDVPDINRIEAQAHTLGPERPEVFLEKLALFGEGCLVLAEGEEILGYGVSFPWTVGEVPPLDTFLGILPVEPDCLYLHDVALLPAVRQRGFGATYVAHATRLARGRGLASLALVSVYGTTTVWAAAASSSGPRATRTRWASTATRPATWWPPSTEAMIAGLTGSFAGRRRPRL